MKLLPSLSSVPTSLNSSAIRFSVFPRGGRPDPSDDDEGPDPTSPTTLLLPVAAAAAAVGSSRDRICIRIRSSEPAVVASKLWSVPAETEGPKTAPFRALAVAEPPAAQAPVIVMLS